MAAVAAVAAVVTAAASVSFGTLNYLQAQDAAAAQKSLQEQQAAQLAAEQTAANNLAASEAVSGQTFAKDSTVAATGLGFGSGGSGQNTGFGRAQLTGGAQS